MISYGGSPQHHLTRYPEIRGSKHTSTHHSMAPPVMPDQEEESNTSLAYLPFICRGEISRSLKCLGHCGCATAPWCYCSVLLKMFEPISLPKVRRASWPEKAWVFYIICISYFPFHLRHSIAFVYLT